MMNLRALCLALAVGLVVSFQPTPLENDFVGPSSGVEVVDVPIANGPPSSNNSNIGLATSNDLLEYFLDLIVPPVATGALVNLGNALPTKCCYATPSHEHLILEDFSIPADDVETTVSVRDDGNKFGPHVEIDLNFHMKFHYKLCQEAGIIYCTPLWPCYGDADLYWKNRIEFDIELAAGEKGGPEVHYKKIKQKITIPDKHGLCFLLSGLLDVALPVINLFLDIFFPSLVGPAVHSIHLPRNFSIPGPLPMNLDWSLTEGTGSTDSGLAFQGIFDLLLASDNYQPAPFLAGQSLPFSVNNLKEHVSTFDITDAFFNNIFYIVANKFQDFEFDTTQDGFKIKINFAAQPLVNFTSDPGNQGTMLTLNTHISLTKLPLKVVVNSIEEFRAALLFNDEGQLYLSIDPDMVLNITSMTPPQPNATKQYIQNQVEAAFASFIPQLNEDLAANPIALPFPGVSSPSLTYYDGYVQLQFDTHDAAFDESLKYPLPAFPPNVIDFSGRQMINEYVEAAIPVATNVAKIMWEAMHSENPKELLPYVTTGFPEDKETLSCPALAGFSSC